MRKILILTILLIIGVGVAQETCAGSYPDESIWYNYPAISPCYLWVRDTAFIEKAVAETLVVTGGLEISGGSSVANLDVASLQTGTSGSYDILTTGSNVWQIYGNDTISTGYTNGISVSLEGTNGDGTGALRGFQGSVTSSSGSSYGELYCDSKYLIVEDGSDIASNVYNIWYLDIEETNAADVGTGYKSAGVFIYETSGSNPSCNWTTPGFTAAVAGVVKDDANTTPGATVLAFAEGDVTGTTIPSAFKAVSVRSTAGGGFRYGIDFYDEAGFGENIQTADIRLMNGSTIKGTGDNIEFSDTIETIANAIPDSSINYNSVLEGLIAAIDSITHGAADSVIIGWTVGKPDTIMDVR